MTDSSNTGANLGDPMDFLRKMWGNMGIPIPGMVVPTLDVNELEKKITDLKAVEGWLKMNLNMLQLHIQGLEMQCTTLTSMKNFANTVEASDSDVTTNPFTNPAMWPWTVMMQAAAAANADHGPSNQKKKKD